MHFITLLALSATAAIAAPTANQTLTVSDYIFLSNNVGRIPSIKFNLSVDGVTCGANDYAIPSTGYTCSDSAYTFDILGPIGSTQVATSFRLYYTPSTGSALVGDFNVLCNGPLPTILDQVGTAEVTLTPA